eukprot:GHVO01028033.1.p1 GENE.GHVO01028033.1~~GHVO01028033.1.p1  ORF type:complete len:229 (-),score=44.61 GHVO01028033.1:71-757(-)
MRFLFVGLTLLLNIGLCDESYIIKGAKASLDKFLTYSNAANTPSFAVSNSDADLSEGLKRVKMIGCFQLIQNEVGKNNAQLKEVADQMSAMNIRQDELMRIFYYGFLSACYHNALEEDVGPMVGGTVTPTEAARLLDVKPDTPYQFDEKQSSILRSISEQFQADESDLDTGRAPPLVMRGKLGVLYAMGFLGAVVAAFGTAAYYLLKMAATPGKPVKLEKNKEKKKNR